MKSLFFNLTLCLTISSLFALYPKEMMASEVSAEETEAEEVGAARNKVIVPSFDPAEKGIDDFVFERSSKPEKQPTLIPQKKDFSFDARTIAGIMYYRFEENWDDGTSPSWQDNMPFLGVGFRLGYKTFSLDTYFQQSASGKDSLFQPRDKNAGVHSTKDYNSNLSRKDYAINLSYSKALNLLTRSDGIGLSVGYKIGKTDITGPRRRIDDEGKINLGVDNYEELQYDTEGPSVGMAYSFKVGESILGINLAYAKLKTSYASKELDDATLEDTDGFTVGLRWNSNFTKHFKYDISIDAYQYSMTGKSKKLGNFEVEESVLSAKISLHYTF